MVTTKMRPFSPLTLLLVSFCNASTSNVIPMTTESDCAMMEGGECKDNVPPIADDDPILDCGVYMAPSTLGEDTNMGIYTGKPLKSGQVVNFPEIAIPLLFREWGEHREGFDDGELWDRYIWEGSVANLEAYTETNREDSRAVFVPGIGCTVNSVMDMNNIESTSGSIYDTAGLHRSKDPGSGAFCPYHSSNTTASRDVEPGSELFASYGDYWIPLIPGAQITLEAEMEKAEEFLRNDYWPWIQAHQAELTPEMKEALWELTYKDFPVYSKIFTNLPRFPWKEVETALEFHKAPVYSVVKKFLREQSVRKPEWLHRNGYCQDHIRPGRSTIPQAGRGAFATRDLPEGTVVGYSPLIHMGVHGRELYYITYKDMVGGVAKKRKQYDLILNYSFGSKNSTVLLTPYGGMVNFINHASGDQANVKVRWPNKELIAHKPDWLNKAPEQLRDTLEKIGLSFEYVAIKPIKAGEEVFMDYGEEWEQAWQEHLKNWKPPKDSDDYIHSTEWPEDYIRTTSESPYPDNLVVMCIESYSEYGEGGQFMWLPPMVETQQRIYCKALERSAEQPYYYKVEMTFADKTSIVVEDVPAEGIFLYDRAFSADWHLPNVFRHEIMIPDDVLPEAWKNGPGYDPSMEPASEPDSEDDEDEVIVAEEDVDSDDDEHDEF